MMSAKRVAIMVTALAAFQVIVLSWVHLADGGQLLVWSAEDAACVATAVAFQVIVLSWVHLADGGQNLVWVVEDCRVLLDELTARSNDPTDSFAAQKELLADRHSPILLALEGVETGRFVCGLWVWWPRSHAAHYMEAVALDDELLSLSDL
jgi:hypothetical protein